MDYEQSWGKGFPDRSNERFEVNIEYRSLSVVYCLVVSFVIERRGKIPSNIKQNYGLFDAREFRNRSKWNCDNETVRNITE